MTISNFNIWKKGTSKWFFKKVVVCRLNFLFFFLTDLIWPELFWKKSAFDVICQKPFFLFLYKNNLCAKSRFSIKSKNGLTFKRLHFYNLLSIYEALYYKIRKTGKMQQSQNYTATNYVKKRIFLGKMLVKWDESKRKTKSSDDERRLFRNSSQLERAPKTKVPTPILRSQKCLYAKRRQNRKAF